MANTATLTIDPTTRASTRITIRARAVRRGDRFVGTCHRTMREVAFTEHDRERGIAKLFTEGGCRWLPLDAEVEIDRPVAG